jgi:nucleotide-binding universal stress UspA family protein
VRGPRSAARSRKASEVHGFNPCDIRIEESSQPWRSILAAGEAVNASLIVLGSHGYHGWDRVLGTTAGNLANRALRSIMIIHDRASRG